MALTHGNEVMMRATDESAFIGEICNIIRKDCGYTMVWIGTPKTTTPSPFDPWQAAVLMPGISNRWISPGRIPNAAEALLARPSAPAG